MARATQTPAPARSERTGASPPATAQSDLARRLAAAVPAWAWLAGIVGVSTVVRAAIARRNVVPWIFDDELIYARLAESFASTGSFAVRGVHGLLGYGPGYPLLIAPAWALFGDAAQAYDAAKVVNALAMSLGAVPAYLIARTLLGRGLSLVAAAFAVAIPSLAYTNVIMTENAFYPAFLLCTLALVRMVDKPTIGRQAAVFVAIALAYAVRAQAVVFVPALVTTLVVFATLEARAARGGPRALVRSAAAFGATWITLAVGAPLVLAVQLARGRNLGDMLGAYRDLTAWHYSVTSLGEWLVVHLAELDLYLGVLPFAALIVVCASACRRSPAARELRVFAAVTAPLVLCLALSAATLASRLEELGGVGRIEERNAFYVAPLFLIALLVWAQPRFAAGRAPTLLAAAAAGALPAAIPYVDFVNLGTLSDTLALVPIARRVALGQLDADYVVTVVVAVTAAAAAFFAFVPRRLAVLGPILVAAYFVVWQASINQQMHQTSELLLRASFAGQRAWIDRAAGRDVEVAAFWTGAVDGLALQQNEFFSRSVNRVYAVDGAPPLGQQVPELPSRIDPISGALLGGDGRLVRARYALVDATMRLAGTALAQDPALGLRLYRTPGRVRLQERVLGLYGDGYSGATVGYTRFRCRPGRLLLTVSPYPGLLHRPQFVFATVDGRGVGRLLLPEASGSRTLAVPVHPGRDGRCDVGYRIYPTAVPRDVLPVADARQVGVHVDRLHYSPTGTASARP